MRTESFAAQTRKQNMEINRCLASVDKILKGMGLRQSVATGDIEDLALRLENVKEAIAEVREIFYRMSCFVLEPEDQGVPESADVLTTPRLFGYLDNIEEVKRVLRWMARLFRDHGDVDGICGAISREKNSGCGHCTVNYQSPLAPQQLSACWVKKFQQLVEGKDV